MMEPKKYVCIGKTNPPGIWKDVGNGEFTTGPKFNEVVTLRSREIYEEEVYYQFYEYSGYFLADYFIPLLDQSLGENLENIEQYEEEKEAITQE